MNTDVSFLGFGEAAQTFARSKDWILKTCGFDIKTNEPSLRLAKLEEFERLGVAACLDARTALSHPCAIFSLVTADQALNAAEQASPYLSRKSIYIDMNSVAPAKKVSASELVTASGARYVDAAIMAPVETLALAVPILLSGSHAEDGADILSKAGFSNVRIVGPRIGDAAAIKMIRSVMIKGIEALTAECMLAAHRADVTDAVLTSLGETWLVKANYNLDRMLVHGVRRSAEMAEVCDTLESLGISPIMSESTRHLQGVIGDFATAASVPELSDKLALIDRQASTDAA